MPIIAQSIAIWQSIDWLFNQSIDEQSINRSIVCSISESIDCSKLQSKHSVNWVNHPFSTFINESINALITIILNLKPFIQTTCRLISIWLSIETSHNESRSHCRCVANINQSTDQSIKHSTNHPSKDLESHESHQCGSWHRPILNDNISHIWCTHQQTLQKILILSTKSIWQVVTSPLSTVINVLLHNDMLPSNASR